MKPVDAFPLAWPAGRPRQHGRESAKFKTVLSTAVQNVQREVQMLGGKALTISSNLPLRQDGFPSSRGGYIADVGVAVYFSLKKKPMSFACDRWSQIEHNMQAIALTIGALRGLERWGSGQMVEAAFQGFAALPAVEQWWQVLKVKSDASFAEIEEAYRKLASVAHPDHESGNEDWMSRVNRARDQAMERFT